MTNRLPFVQRLTAFYQVLHILSRNRLFHMKAPCPTRTENVNRVLTHTMTHEQKKWDGNNGEKRICGCENPAVNPLYSPEIPRKAALSNLHTPEALSLIHIWYTDNIKNWSDCYA